MRPPNYTPSRGPRRNIHDPRSGESVIRRCLDPGKALGEERRGVVERGSAGVEVRDVELKDMMHAVPDLELDLNPVRVRRPAPLGEAVGRVIGAHVRARPIALRYPTR